MNDTYAYCKIFVRDIDLDTTKETVTRLFGGQFQRHSMNHGQLVLEVRRNPDASTDERLSNDFVLWPVTVEVDAEDETDSQVVVDTTSRLLRALWDSDHPAVAACDYETELPWSGGIQRLEGPE